MMIRNILIITVIAALVPTAMSNVSASAGSEIALFSGALTLMAYQYQAMRTLQKWNLRLQTIMASQKEYRTFK